MEFIELSIEDLKETTKKLYNKVNKNYKYDLVIFVARGSYLIGEELAHLNEVPLLEIKATRKGGKLKKIVSPLLVILPSNLKIFLRKKEIKSNYHKTNSERQIEIDENKKEKPYQNSGIEQGDTIVEINGNEVGNTEELINAVNDSKRRVFNNKICKKQ